MRLKRAIALVGISTAALVAYNAWHSQNAPVRRASARLLEYDWGGWSLRYRLEGAGESTPVVLVHDLSSDASLEDYADLIPTLARTRRVYALDLPGFGFSERQSAHYDAALLRQALEDFLREVVGQPAHLLATHLSAGVAAALPGELVRSLALNCPTGRSLPSKLWSKALQVPVWGEALWNLRGGAPGAHRIAAALEAGAFESDLGALLERGHHPVIILCSGRVPSAPPLLARELRDRAEEARRVDLVAFPSAAEYPHLEEPGRYLSTLERFWNSVEAAQA
ncbi:pimeloyl-ACP methyl ester carboxylesterase [Deinobacterium chartae]|uniref:Pimeloyl-ACP methyl ester carboxylesterase n=1 Tax=Deinobacterium chartae TaxID=521158 RepID=A0A841HXQ4_9DEIO|nr:alpha/beta fold hydrolase [Deinobacterium chartae]MBB6096698.1 pimeloyl-ACP methyl ester carboxylesterase [Deinobacterium chartae]